MVRIGIGKDIHNLIAGDQIVLGGVTFKSNYQIQAHSDGDVIYHALANAILAAICEPDIGCFFSDQDPSNRNLNSEHILDLALAKLSAHHLKFHNICLSLTCQQIKINSIKDQILDNLTKKLTPYFQQKVLISLHATSFEDNSNHQIMCEVALTVS